MSKVEAGLLRDNAKEVDYASLNWVDLPLFSRGIKGVSNPYEFDGDCSESSWLLEDFSVGGCLR